MEKGREEWYELLETPYETIDETRRELFETLEWKQVVAQLFDMFSSYREEVWIDVANIQEDWDLVKAIATLVKTITMNYSDEEKDSFIDAVMKQLRYFKAEFKNREIEQLDLTTEEWFSKLLDVYNTIEKQSWMRAKLHAKLMLNLTEEEMEVVEKENLLLEDFLEKEKKNKRIIEAYAQEVNEIFNSTWGVEFWIWRSRESLKAIGIENPTNEDIMEIAERAFNGYLKDIFWTEVWPLHFTAISMDQQEELLKAELWFAKFYAYLLKNQIPN